MFIKSPRLSYVPASITAPGLISPPINLSTQDPIKFRVKRFILNRSSHNISPSSLISLISSIRFRCKGSEFKPSIIASKSSGKDPRWKKKMSSEAPRTFSFAEANVYFCVTAPEGSGRPFLFFSGKISFGFFGGGWDMEGAIN